MRVRLDGPRASMSWVSTSEHELGRLGGLGSFLFSFSILFSPPFVIREEYRELLPTSIIFLRSDMETSSAISQGLAPSLCALEYKDHLLLDVGPR
jgi:hypothetical protein